MATTLGVNPIKASLGWDFENVLTLGNTSNINTFTYSKTLAQGTAANQADNLYISQTTIAGGGNLTLDLAGSLLDVFGNTITMARVKTIYIELTTDTSASSIAIGNGTNPFINWISPSTATIKVNNGGCFFLSAVDATGYAVTAATGDVLKILNNDGSNIATLKIGIVGASA